MDLSVDATSSVPPFEQVRTQVIAQIDAGELVAGTRLPPVRALATELGLAANTVARAYKELEEAGYVETRGRAGTFVKGADAASARAAVRRARMSRLCAASGSPRTMRSSSCGRRCAIGERLRLAGVSPVVGAESPPASVRGG